MVSCDLMQFEHDEVFRREDYVTPEEFAKRYPNGAIGVLCRYCGCMLLLPPGDHPDCGMHKN